jgi:hypothetical protein
MLSNYLRIALRNLRRQPGYAAINVLGLGVGMAACLLIGLFALTTASTRTPSGSTGPKSWRSSGRTRTDASSSTRPRGASARGDFLVIADLVLLYADPTADLRNTRLIRAVIAHGRLFDRSKLHRLLETAEAFPRCQYRAITARS